VITPPEAASVRRSGFVGYSITRRPSVNTVKKALLSCTAIILTLTVTACNHHRQEVESADAATAMENLMKLQYPIESTELSVNDGYKLLYAEDLLMASCMKRAGFTWQPIQPPKQRISSASRRYGVMDAAAADAFGYHLPPPPKEATLRINRENELTPASRKAAFGSNGRKGCYQHAHNAISGTAKEVDLKLFNTLNRKSLKKSKLDARVVKAVKAWSACMQGSGYSYTDPFQAAGDPSWANSKKVSEEERKAALTDVACKEKSELISTWAGVEYDLQRQYIRQNADYFSQVRESKKERIANMDSIINIHSR
jgi:hypothetical protein